MKEVVRRSAVGSLFVLSLAAAMPAGALPASPRRFVDNLDERCYQIQNQPSINLPLRLDHLNPLFVSMGLPFESVVLQAPQQLCVPVEKNSTPPPSDTLPYIQYIDWKCYGITGSPLNLPLQLTQLNPIFARLFGTTVSVTVREPQLLCVPVAKNNVIPPSDALQIVQFMDVKCYRVDSTQNVTKPVTLNHLNPLLSTRPSEVSTVGPTPQQLCVPVEKNQQPPSSTALPFVQYSDTLCYPATGASLGQNLTLTHLDPLLIAMHLPVESVFVGSSLKLCVPVAKNGMLPPGTP